MRCAILLVPLCAAACAIIPVPTAPTGATPPAPPDPSVILARDVQALRDEAKALLKAQAELAWKSWALGEAVDFGAAYQGHERLFSVDAVRKVKALEEKETNAEAALALHALRLYLAGEILARATAEESESVAHVAAVSILNVDGVEYPFRELETLLANEGHTGKRRKLYKASVPVVHKMEALLLNREKRLAETAATLGYTSLDAFAADLRHVDVPALRALAEDLLARTDPPYRAAMDELARRELALGLSDVRRADIPRLFRTGDVDTYFPKDKALERLTGTLARLGLDPAHLPQMTIDAAPHARKNPRAFAVALEAGKDVRLSMRPAAGFSAAAQLFHETGHATKAALTRTDVFELQALESGAAGEAFGYLFENLLDAPAFGAAMGIPETKLAAHAKVSALRKLFLLRRTAGRFLFETARSGASETKPSDLYREVMTRALGFPAEPEDGARWLSDNEDVLSSADPLRGLVASAQIEASLAAALGGEWWSDSKSGVKLAEWCAPGAKLTVDELVRLAGAQGLDVGPVTVGLTSRLGSRVGAAGPAAP